jgi:RecB family exonuclease
VLFGEEAVLLDYKTGVVEAKHQKQLQRYGELLEQMGYRLKAAYLLYIGEEEQIVEVI